jgi:hypothetical protein
MALTTATLVPGPQLEVMIGLDVWRAHQVDATRVHHDELRALA